MARFKTIGLAFKEKSEDSQAYLDQILSLLTDWSKTQKVKLLRESSTSKKGSALPIDKLVEKSDLIIAIGGDGTILRCARYFLDSNHWKNTALLGVNRGRMGFLSSLNGAESLQQLPHWLENKTKSHFEDRSAIEIKLLRNKKVLKTFDALNDSVITKSGISRLIEVEVKLDKNCLGIYRADGLIVSTPTGSTAYNLAAKGAVLTPGLKAFQLTPVCSQSASIHPLIFEAGATLELKLLSDNIPAVLTIDGHASLTLKTGDQIQIKKSKKHVRLWMPGQSAHENFVNSLQQKLNWGLVSFNGRATL